MTEPGRDEDFEEVVADVDEEAEVLPASYEISSFGADYPVDGLVARMQRDDVIIPSFDPAYTGHDVTGFQRSYLWTKRQADRFIESLLLGLPVPGIFLVNETETRRLLVLDGQQRLRTLQAFYQGVFRGREFALEFVEPSYQGLTYATLDGDQRRRLDNSIIHATIIRQESPERDNSSIYQIFERLNTGGTLLRPQEIRVALYHGPLVNLLRELNELPSWRQIYGRRSAQLKDQELILRFFSFLYMSDRYRPPMKEFLNHYMSANRSLQEQNADELTRRLTDTTNLIVSSLGARPFRLGPQLNAAVFDSFTVALAELIERDGPIEAEFVTEAYNELLANRDYLAAVSGSTANSDNVFERLRLARRALGVSG
jgi:hypothetical protein